MEIQLYEKMQNPLEGIRAIGEMFAKSGMFGCEKVEQGMVLALECMTQRKAPSEIMRTFHIVEGNLSKKALAALAEFRGKGGKHQWLATGDKPAAKDDDQYAELKLTSPDGETVTYRYSMADAKAEGLVKPRSRWEKRPGNMLRARCISNGIGIVCPEIYAGGDEGESEPSKPSEPLLQPKAEAKAEPVKEAPKPEKEKVVEVTTTVAPIEKAAEKAPEPTRKFTAADVRLDPTGQRLSNETVIALGELIGEHQESALKWLVNKQWIKEAIHELSPERARRIIEKPETFINYVAPKVAAKA